MVHQRWYETEPNGLTLEPAKDSTPSRTLILSGKKFPDLQKDIGAYEVTLSGFTCLHFFVVLYHHDTQRIFTILYYLLQT